MKKRSIVVFAVYVTIAASVAWWLLRQGVSNEFWETRGHSDLIANVTFSPDGNTLATCSNDKTVKLWDVKTGKLKHTFRGHDSHVWELAFSPDGMTLASGSADRTIKLWDLTTLKELAALKGHDTEVTALAFSTDGRWLASGCGSGGAARIWDTGTRQTATVLESGTYIIDFAFSPDGKTLASGDLGHRVKLWDVETWQCRATVERYHSSFNSVQYSTDGKILMTAAHMFKVDLCNPDDLDIVLQIDTKNYVHQAALSSDRKLLATAGEIKTLPGPGPGEAKVWDATTGKLLAVKSYPSQPVSAIGFSPDGKKLAIGGYYDGLIQILEVSDLIAESK